jgi:Raf kinase inhibitor-like YbhB/YbcL family protein
MALSLTSHALVEQGVIPDKYSLAKGENISPPFDWLGAPAGTKSFALTSVDPDVPWGNFELPGPGSLYGDLFVHWIVYDLPASATSLAEGAGSPGTLPQGAKHLNNTARDFGEGTPFWQHRGGWIGCAPPAGDRAHRYVFTLYALNVDALDVSPDASYSDFIEALKDKVLATSTLTSYFGVKAE